MRRRDSCGVGAAVSRRARWSVIGFDDPASLGVLIGSLLTISAALTFGMWGYQKSLRARRALVFEKRQTASTLAALRESEERFRAMADSAPVMVWMSGTNKACTYVNRGWLDMTGRSMAQEIGDGRLHAVRGEMVIHSTPSAGTQVDVRIPIEAAVRQGTGP